MPLRGGHQADRPLSRSALNEAERIRRDQPVPARSFLEPPCYRRIDHLVYRIQARYWARPFEVFRERRHVTQLE